MTWIHIQKTSSWLGDLIMTWGCADIANTYQISTKRERKIIYKSNKKLYKKYFIF
jgi:hypothetical protein